MNDINLNNKFFHFSNRLNLESILTHGLMSRVQLESTKEIYFSKPADIFPSTYGWEKNRENANYVAHSRNNVRFTDGDSSTHTNWLIKDYNKSHKILDSIFGIYTKPFNKTTNTFTIDANQYSLDVLDLNLKDGNDLSSALPVSTKSIFIQGFIFFTNLNMNDATIHQTLRDQFNFAPQNSIVVNYDDFVKHYVHKSLERVKYICIGGENA